MRSTLLCIALGLLTPLAAHAQNGSLIGTMLDAATKRPMPGVTVTVSSPALRGGDQATVTDEAGAFQLAGLPSGHYVLRFEAESFWPYTRAGVHLTGGQTLRLNTELIQNHGEVCVLVVVQAPPVIDVGSAQASVSIDQNHLRMLPLVPR